MDALQTKAYVIFLEELSAQLPLFQRHSAAMPEGEQIEELRILLHRIKGGAGFFGLDQLQQLGARGEHVVKSGELVALAPILRELSQAIERVIQGDLDEQ